MYNFCEKKPNIETNIADECLPTREYTFYSYNFEYSNFLKKMVLSVLTCHLFIETQLIESQFIDCFAMICKSITNTSLRTFL